MGRFGAGQVMAIAGSMLQLLQCNDASTLRQYQCSAQQPRGNHNTSYIDINISTSLQHPNYSQFQVCASNQELGYSSPGMENMCLAPLGGVYSRVSRGNTMVRPQVASIGARIFLL